MSRVLALLECGCKLASILSDVRTRQQLIEENRYLVYQLNAERMRTVALQEKLVRARRAARRPLPLTTDPC